jgi:hypothetical protein
MEYRRSTSSSGNPTSEFNNRSTLDDLADEVCAISEQVNAAMAIVSEQNRETGTESSAPLLQRRPVELFEEVMMEEEEEEEPTSPIRPVASNVAPPRNHARARMSRGGFARFVCAPAH